jgi:hypothetical protein
MTKDEQVAALLRKTVENGATPSEEVAAIQLAYMMVRQNRLDLDLFKHALSQIGDPPRYIITSDGFLLPVTALAAAAPQADATRQGTVRNEETPRPAPARECSHSPTGRHRMEPHYRGTVLTGDVYCIHCGLRRCKS